MVRAVNILSAFVAIFVAVRFIGPLKEKSKVFNTFVVVFPTSRLKFVLDEVDDKYKTDEMFLDLLHYLKLNIPYLLQSPTNPHKLLKHH